MSDDEAAQWVELLVTIATRFHEGGTIRSLFEEAAPDLSDRSAFETVVGGRLRREPILVETWQGYSYDKRSSPSPYMDDVEVGFYDKGRRDVSYHRDVESACADFLFREASWVLNHENPGAR